MTVKIPIDELPEFAEEYGPSAYVVVTGTDGPPRITHSESRFDGDVLVVRLGPRSHRALAAHPELAVLWPATRDQSMSLIADGIAEGALDPEDGGEVRIRPTGAVHHRPA